MHWSNPKVFMIAETKISSGGMHKFLQHIGARSEGLVAEDDWDTNAKTGGEYVVEVAGRLCYRSFKGDGKLNKNVNRVREGNVEYIGNILQQKHGSVLEHAAVTIAACDVSRILTHELVRHRTGLAFSQESGRYVRIDDIGMFKPTCFTSEWLLQNIAPHLTWAGQADAAQWADQMETVLEAVISDHTQKAEEDIAHFCKILGLDLPKMPFHVKKEVTSALRRIAPGGMTNSIIFTANHRAMRHMIAMRTSLGAEEEIRQVFGDYDNSEEMRQVFLSIAHIMRSMFPAFYQDMSIGNDGACTFLNEKV
jgi:thymidylate synthase (FAD)